MTPESLAPAVYVEETSFRGKSIEGVGTGTAAFVGPTLRGPIGIAPELLTRFADYERIYGGLDPLNHAAPDPATNYLAHAVRAFFNEGGERLYVARVAGISPGAAPSLESYQDALAIIERLEDVSIVAAPGHTEFIGLADNGSNRVTLELISHVETRTAHRTAVLDVPLGQSVQGALAFKRSLNSAHAALYYPWVVTGNPGFDPDDPATPPELTLPPSGFLCGIYARIDRERGVWKAPANEIIRSAIRFERALTTGEQGLLNQSGVNCLRHFPGRGHLVWGARTTSSDPEWRYVNIRRYINYLKHSVARGTQWAVFEPNGERLWAAVRQTVDQFLHSEWRRGALTGSRPDTAYFVRCDRSTMTQNDLDHGRLVFQVGVATLRPAEFIILHFSLQTAESHR